MKRIARPTVIVEIIRGLGLVGAAGLIVGAAAAAAGPAPLAVNVVSVTTPLARGAEGTMVVRTAPYAQCGASVQALTDPARTIATLPSRAADPAGFVTF